MKISIKILDNRQLAMEAAEIIRQKARAVSNGGRFFLCLSGGNTPLDTYSHLTAAPFSKSIPWGRFRIFWGDERLVHPKMAESNFGQADRFLLKKAPITRAHIHPIPVDIDHPVRSARKYEEKLRHFWPRTDPLWDLALLGLGADGHTASLFPRDPALTSFRLVVPAEPPINTIPAITRLTLTPKAFNQAKCILFLVTGSEKAEAVAKTLALIQGNQTSQDWPASCIKPSGEVIWLLDKPAAEKLPRTEESDD
ncbi:6-phosphogluconolactonase [Dethiosulfatarculus sandiegensis]|uniref:6-phosphogluconolactonase n=1 Tax=Dethiosulfatarculus sandiegensis TaxID=1429043 RepID=A0A0D2JN39_9BACT|nr:6-phosphogluconolactonase [Dethiosulfatarculus sandiegensis]KIX10905.1 6-phosphogluconolactonase [Dethiosulfatarculus sandiegensis]